MESTENLPYQLTTNNIKFPSYNNPELEQKLLEPVTDEVFKNDLNLLYSKQNDLLSSYSNIIKSNINSINQLSLSYKKKTYDYILLIKAIKYLTSVLINKSSPSIKEEEIKIDDFFNNEEFKKLIELQYQNDLDKNLIINEIKPIIEHGKLIKESNHKFGILFMDSCVKYLIDFLEKLKNQLETFISIKNFNEVKNEEEKLKNHIILLELLKSLEKIDNIDLVLNNSFYIDEKDINNIPEESEEWDKIKKKYFRVIPKNEKLVIETFKKLIEANDKGQALLYNSFKTNSNFINIFNVISTGIKYKLNNIKAIYEAKKMQISPSNDWMLKALNVSKTKIVKKFNERFYPKINFHKKLYLKREYPEITRDYISKLLNFLYKNEGKKEEVKISKIENNTLPLYLEQIEKSNKENYVSTRLFHSSKITFESERQNPKKSLFNFFQQSNQKNETKNTILIHIHGGGFIATTTFFHEKYLRTWSNTLKIPIIGINYGLSPQYKYPKGLNDCFQGYMWIINHMEKKLDMKIDNIILSGDSAGGNLCLALTFLLIAINKYENINIRLPDLVLAEYPCSDTSIKNMSLSMIIALQDPLLHDKLLKYCNECYRNDYLIEEDPFLNPVKANDILIKELPRTRFYLGTLDPLRDDSLRLIYKISKYDDLNVNTYEFKGYGHGFFALESDILKTNPQLLLFKEIEEFLNDRNKKD